MRHKYAVDPIYIRYLPYLLPLTHTNAHLLPHICYAMPYEPAQFSSEQSSSVQFSAYVHKKLFHQSAIHPATPHHPTNKRPTHHNAPHRSRRALYTAVQYPCAFPRIFFAVKMLRCTANLADPGNLAYALMGIRRAGALLILDGGYWGGYAGKAKGMGMGMVGVGGCDVRG
ncbi:hypothetical protein BDV95DRAFT_390272 [Massariosphaeria phaeospora]|uniref:Uncharacterized protein n=1 Tax=Massariosphaeria phaeospora TaxID=100035 RepID=A0A7C8IGU2_9PLEO|nr:hypothetical protein BDV95DRAFT_390272 [Massariosphaeria phaeospora]